MSQNQLQEQKTLVATKEDRKLNWLIFDAEGKTLGRFASEIAKVLRGKHKPTYTPHVDMGDGVIIINAGKIKVTGSKPSRKIYRRYTGHIGGMREIPFNIMQARKPEYIIERAVHGMLPKTKLGRGLRKRLRIFAGTDHQMPAQKPIQVNI